MTDYHLNSNCAQCGHWVKNGRLGICEKYDRQALPWDSCEDWESLVS